MTEDVVVKDYPRIDAAVAVYLYEMQCVHVGYWGVRKEFPPADCESDWQVQNEAWCAKVGLQDVGYYFVNVPRNYFIAVEDFRPSAYVAQAENILNLLRKQGCKLAVTAYMNDTWEVAVGHPTNSRYTRIASDTQLSTAICTAALRFYRIDIESILVAETLPAEMQVLP